MTLAYVSHTIWGRDITKLLICAIQTFIAVVQ